MYRRKKNSVTRSQGLQSNHRGGSLILEATIVLALAGVLLAVLIPSFMKSRIAARRVHCLNNLRNVVLALHNYQEVHQVFPPGYVARNVQPDDPSELEQGPGWGWGALILPNMDQTALQRTFNFSGDVPSVTTMVSVFLCPNQPSGAFGVSSSHSGLVTLAPSNFIGVAGTIDFADRPGRPSSPGMFHRNSAVRLDDVPDGISQTLIVGERTSVFEHPDMGTLDSSSTWVGAVSGVLIDAGDLDDELVEGPGALLLGSVGHPRRPQMTTTPNSAPRRFGFSSTHDRGANFARVDGSCSFVSESIDPIVFRRLGQRADSVIDRLPPARTRQDAEPVAMP
jgi:type II secretory pathway pseudopilin PulG